MRRLPALVLAVVGVLALLPAAAVAEVVVDSDPGAELVLAAEAEPSGPEPMPRDAEENPARDLGDFADREIPFTWAAAWLLTALGIVGVVFMIVFYRVRVLGPAKERAGS